MFNNTDFYWQHVGKETAVHCHSQLQHLTMTEHLQASLQVLTFSLTQ